MVTNNNFKRVFELAMISTLGVVVGSVFLFVGLRLSGVAFSAARDAVLALAAIGGAGFVWMAVRGYRTGRWVSGNTHITPMRSTLAMLKRAFPTGMRVAEQAVIFAGLAIATMILVVAASLVVPWGPRVLRGLLVGTMALATFGFVWATMRGLRGKGWLRLGANVAPWMDGVGGPALEGMQFGHARERYAWDTNPATGYSMIGILDSAGNAYGSSALSSDQDRVK